MHSSSWLTWSRSAGGAGRGRGIQLNVVKTVAWAYVDVGLGGKRSDDLIDSRAGVGRC
ncbi:hypothetical protein SNL152K_2778 [Streptomyces sp. NL15-2K]|nr:hypothetical protein SNL152K_2778 [Streptomyces sp. NL15-2K]